MTPLDRLIDARIARERWMQWRIARFGFACLTQLEAEAMRYEVDAARMLAGCSERGRLEYVAKQMRISRSTAHEHLMLARRACLYFDEHDIPFGWSQVGGFYRLHAPIQPEKFFRRVIPEKTALLCYA